MEGEIEQMNEISAARYAVRYRVDINEDLQLLGIGKYPRQGYDESEEHYANKEKIFNGAEFMFGKKDKDGEFEPLHDLVFQIGMEGMDEKDVPKLTDAMAMLVRLGAEPADVVEFVSKVDAGE